MKDPILLNNLWKEVDAGRVSASKAGDLTLFKYTIDTHIKDLWNPVNRLARGIILRTDGTIIARPFEKFFNLGEKPETELKNLPNEPYEIWEKTDGSCGIGHYIDDKWKLATPGSFESEQAIEGTKILYEYNLAALPLDCTPLFEIIYPENRIVVDYSGKRELVLLAILEKNGEEWHSCRVDQVALMCGFRRPKRYNFDLYGEIPFNENEEGYVVRFQSGLRVKVKSPTYLRIHRLLNYMTPVGVIELIRGKEYGTTLKQLPDYIQRDMDDIRAYVQSMHDTILRNAHTNFNSMVSSLSDSRPRKDYALWIQANVPKEERGLVFLIIDNKDIEDSIWKLVIEKVKNGV